MDFWTIDFFSPPTLWGWLKGVFFVEGRNRFKGGVLGSFSIALMSFWTIEFFPPPTLGGLQGEVFIYDAPKIIVEGILQLL